MSGGISIVGAGNVASSLAVAFEEAGLVVNEIYSRDPDNANRLVGRLYQASVVTDLDFTESPSELLIIAISDDAIREVAEELYVPEHMTVAHTSGSVSMDTLDRFSNTGVFYPLQSFSRDKLVSFKNIPLLIEGSDSRVEKYLASVAGKISKDIVITDSEARENIHLAAVFASNFSNHMIHIAHNLLEEYGMDTELLTPLISETIHKSLSLGPEAAQTGPARRGDIEILNRHLKKLKDHPELGSIYKKISEHILKKFS